MPKGTSILNIDELTLGEVESQVRRYAAQLGRDTVGTPLTLTTPWPPKQFARSRNFVVPTLAPARDRGMDVLLLDSVGTFTRIAGGSGEVLLEVELNSKMVAPPASLCLADGTMGVVIAHYNGRVELLDSAGKRRWISVPGLDLGRLVLRPLVLDVNESSAARVTMAYPCGRQGRSE